jgi:iron complex outermembrane recepter protein
MHDPIGYHLFTNAFSILAWQVFLNHFFMGKGIIASFLVTSLVLFCSSFIYAQNEINGMVTDAVSGLPLNRVSLYIPDLKTGASSDSNGRYIIKNIPPGTYIIEVSTIGYAGQIERLVVKGTVKRDYVLNLSATELNDVIVTGVPSATDKQKAPISVIVVSKKDLLENPSTNVIDAISKVPGVSAMTDGQSISKPVIRGLGYNRVLTVNDGVQQIDQAWFDEFGIEADPDAVNRYEILKGPGSLAYGSDAIAGVVNLVPEQPLSDGQTKGDVLFNYQTNNGLINTMGHLAGATNGIAWSVRMDNIMAHAYQNAFDGYALNSQFSNFNVDGTISLHRKWGYTQLHASYFDMATGIVDGTRDSATGTMMRQVAYPDLNGGQPTYEIPTK